MLAARLVGDDGIDAVEGDAAIVTDDATTAIAVGQTGDDAGAACALDFLGVGIEHAGVMGATVFGEDMVDFRVDLVTVGFQCAFRHADTTVGHQGTLQRLVGLDADDLFVVLVDIARRMGNDAADHLGISVDHPAFVQFLLVEFKHLVPDFARALGGRRKESAVTQIGGKIAVNEVAHIDRMHPITGFKTFPGVFADGGCRSRAFSHEDFLFDWLNG